MALVLLAVIVALAVHYGQQGSRSFAVEAVTGAATVTFDGSERAVWRIERAVVCARLKRGTAAATTGPYHPDCAATLYSAREARSLEFRWPAKMTAAITTDGSLLTVTLISSETSPETPELDVGDGQQRLGPGSRILLKREDLVHSLPLPVSGEIALGTMPTAGVGGILFEGRYVVRETLPLRDEPIKVSDGQLFAGDKVSFQNTEPQPKQEHQPAYGFLTAMHKDLPGFTMITYSSLGLSRMRIDRFGNETAYVASAWTERAVRDPLLIGITAILGLLAAMTGFWRDGYDLVAAFKAKATDKEEEMGETQEPEPDAPPDQQGASLSPEATSAPTETGKAPSAGAASPESGGSPPAPPNASGEQPK